MKEPAESQLESCQVSPTAEYALCTQHILSMTLLFVHVLVVCEQKLAKKTRCLSSSSIDNEMDSIVTIASDIWNELVEASRIESLLNTKPFYDVIVKIEDPTNSKIMLDFKRPMEMSLEECKS